MVLVSPQVYQQCHPVLTSPKGPKVKRCRCPVFTGPAGRRQSRWCRSVHESHAEMSIRCPPVHGARAPTERPNPTSSSFRCRSWDALTESHGPRTVEPQTGDRLRRSQPGTCRLACANLGPRAPTDHPRIIDHSRATASYCPKGLMPQTAEIAWVIGVPRRLTAQPLQSVRRGALSPVRYLPTQHRPYRILATST
jgi:hypothetical protein